MKLWQSIEKHHMEKMTGKVISDDDWEDFVDATEDFFASAVSTFALNMWEDWEK